MAGLIVKAVSDGLNKGRDPAETGSGGICGAPLVCIEDSLLKLDSGETASGRDMLADRNEVVSSCIV